MQRRTDVMAECLQDLLQCSVCLERFTQPKGLPCQHTFCLNCLRGIVKDEKILACPQCRTEHQLPENGVDGLLDNIIVKNLLKIVTIEDDSMTARVHVPCFDCGQKKSVVECQHCKESVCDSCHAEHKEILAEIDVLLTKSQAAASKENDEEGAAVLLRTLMEEIAKEKAEFPEIFQRLRENIIEKIIKQEENISQILDIFEKRVLALESAIEKSASLTETNYKELAAYNTISSLHAFKKLINQADEGLSAYLQNSGNGLKILYPRVALAASGKVKLGQSVVDIRFGDSLVQKEGSPIQLQNSLPVNVDYKERDVFVIDQHTDSTKKLIPTYAIYSHRLDAIFCVSEGRVLMYGSGGRADPSFVSENLLLCNHIAITDSGKLVVAERSTIYIFNFINSHILEARSTIPKLEIKMNSVKSIDQLCCNGKEFAALARNEKKITIFSEEASFIREFCVESVTPGSRMTISQNGQICLTGEVTIDRRNNFGETKGGCADTPAKHSLLNAVIKVEIIVYSWTGQLVHSVELCNISTIHRYGFQLRCGSCKKLHKRYTEGLSDDVIKNKSIRGLCSDGDGLLSIASPNEIRVYHQLQFDIKLVTTVGRHVSPKGGFEGELEGISMMPDGRMIVCEKGSNRIVVL